MSIDLIWSSEYALGHREIDTQHQRLFTLYGVVCDAFNEGKGQDVIQTAVNNLVTYTKQHFHDEESLMARAGYEGLGEHRKKHIELLKEVTFFVDELEQGKPVLIYEVLAFLREWLTNHILDEDMKLKDSLIKWA